MKRILFTAVALAFAGASQATPQVAGDGACGIRAVDNESFVSCDGDRAPDPVGPESVLAAQFPPAMPIAARQARGLKRDLGARVLVVDIRSRAEASFVAAPVAADALVPFMEPAPGFVRNAGGALAMEFNPGFLAQMDETLAGAGLGHGDAVVLLCRAEDCRREAPGLLREHGYEQLFVVGDGFDTQVAAAPR